MSSNDPAPTNAPQPENTPSQTGNTEDRVKAIVKSALEEWLEEKNKTRTDAAKPKSFLDGVAQLMGL